MTRLLQPGVMAVAVGVVGDGGTVHSEEMRGAGQLCNGEFHFQDMEAFYVHLCHLSSYSLPVHKCGVFSALSFTFHRAAQPFVYNNYPINVFCCHT